MGNSQLCCKLFLSLLHRVAAEVTRQWTTLLFFPLLVLSSPLLPAYTNYSTSAYLTCKFLAPKSLHLLCSDGFSFSDYDFIVLKQNLCFSLIWSCRKKLKKKTITNYKMIFLHVENYKVVFIRILKSHFNRQNSLFYLQNYILALPFWSLKIRAI